MRSPRFVVQTSQVANDPICFHGLTHVTESEALQAEVDALKRLQAETAAELDALLPAILDHAFKGEL
jgi:hypothetical protein